MTDRDELDALTRAACEGDADALESIVRAVQDDVFGLALRTLGTRADAEDASQEILVLVVTKLSTLRGDSHLRTWVYTVATRYLLRARERSAREKAATFELLGQGLAQAPTPVPPDALAHVELSLLVEEAFVGCTTAMLLGLDREHRLAFILSDILNLDGKEAAAALEISPATYRKRVSRARERLDGFLADRCSVLNDEAPCRCENQVAYNVTLGRLAPSNLLLTAGIDADTAAARQRARAQVAEMAAIRRTVEMYRGHPELRSPVDFGKKVRQLL